MTTKDIIFAILNTNYGAAAAESFDSTPLDQQNEKNLRSIATVCTELLDNQILSRAAHYEVSAYLTSLNKQLKTLKGKL